MTQSKELLAIIEVIPENFADPNADFHAVRDMFAPFHGHPTSDELEIEIANYGGVRCGSYTLKGADNKYTAFHCHGGAFVSSGLDEYHFYAEIIARHVGCNVVMPDYRLAPEHPYPAAPDDCLTAYCGLLEQGIDPAGIILVGESCGGSLALGLLVQLRDKGLPLPACFISLTGWFDLAVSGQTVAGRDPFLTPQWVRNRGLDYLAGQLSLDDPRVSPANADLRGLPPMYIQIGQFDAVREGAISVAGNAMRSGVHVTVEAWPGMVQGWHGLVTAGVPEAIEAWAAIRRYIETLSAGGSSTHCPTPE